MRPLVEPDLEAGGLRLRAGLDRVRQGQRAGEVRPRVRQEQERHHPSRSRPTIAMNTRTCPSLDEPRFRGRHLLRLRARGSGLLSIRDTAINGSISTERSCSKGSNAAGFVAPRWLAVV